MRPLPLVRRRRLDELQARLEDAERTVRDQRRRLAALEGPRDLQYLFVVTYGRSGSTLLQGILNSIPGYLIRGENRQALTHLHEFHALAVRTRRQQRREQRRHEVPVGGSSPVDAFYGMDGFPARRSLAGIRRLAVQTLLRPEADTRVVGFKEIRWDAEDVGDFVAWLREVFPGARFVVNTRDLAAVAQSKWWAETPDAAERLAAVEQRLLALADDLGAAAYHVRYDDYVADPGTLAPFFDWLGEPFDEATVRTLLDVPHSY